MPTPSSPSPYPQRTEEQLAAIRRRALPVALGALLLGSAGLALTLLANVSAYAPPNFLAMNLSFCAMLIAAAIFLYAKGTPGTRLAQILCGIAFLAGSAGTMLYTRQAVLGQGLRESTEMANVAAIATAARDYAHDHAGKYPADILVLIEDHRLNPEALQSPLGDNNPLFTDFAATTKAAKSRDELLQTIETKGDYLYLGGDLQNVPPDLAKDLIVVVSNRAVLRISLAIAFADSSTRFVDKTDLSQILASCNAARAKMNLGKLTPPEIIQKALDDLAAEKADK